MRAGKRHPGKSIGWLAIALAACMATVAMSIARTSAIHTPLITMRLAAIGIAADPGK